MLVMMIAKETSSLFANSLHDKLRTRISKQIIPYLLYCTADNVSARLVLHSTKQGNKGNDGEDDSQAMCNAIHHLLKDEISFQIALPASNDDRKRNVVTFCQLIA